MNRIKRICALLLAIVLILGVVFQPGIGGVFAENTEQTEQITESTTQAVTEATTQPAEEPIVLSFYEQLMACGSLDDFDTLLRAEKNTAAFTALTREELKQLLERVEEISAAIAEPTEADTLLKEELLKELNEQIPVICPECGETDGHAETCSQYKAEDGDYVKAALTDTGEAQVYEGDPSYIYFDLAAGNVNIGADSYSGMVYIDGTATEIKGIHAADNKYYIYQSNLKDESSAGYYKNTGYLKKGDSDETQNCRIPKYPRVKNGKIPWTQYITNNTKVKEVIDNWADAANVSGRTPTKNRITFDQESGYTANVTIDNIWSDYYEASTSRKTGGIGAHLDNMNNTTISLRLKGDNRVGCVHYSSDKYSGNQLIFSNGDDDSNPGSITVADFPDDLDANHWNAAIGAADNPADSADMSEGIVINGGVIYAGTTPEDNCTAIGGGGNQYGSVTINNGTVTAVVSSTGTAIGGGIGYNNQGGDTDVTINDGIVYAYNLGIDKKLTGGFPKFVPAAAIGGGGSKNSAGNLNASITITGGTIYAQSFGGPGIGGGGSANSNGGPAKITITGGTIIAKSISGKYGTQDVSAGVSIGGGTGDTGGGAVTLNISGKETVLRTGSIGGGKTNGTGTIGNADVTIIDGDITGQVIMAGTGDSNKKCSFTMEGGKLHGTNVVDGNTITDINDPNQDAKIEYIQEDGGAVWMDDPIGAANINGGVIEDCTANLGGAIYMKGGKFTLSGTGNISGNTAKRTAATATTAAKGGMGGGVYVTGGDANIEGGFIQKNTAQIRGGGVYVTGGNVNVNGGSISSNVAGFGEISEAVGRGGGVYLEGAGLFTMNGGTISGNTAKYRGGGIFLTKKPVLIKGTISGNKAEDSGGGICVNGDAVELESKEMEIFGNNAKNGGGVAVLNGSFILSGGAVGVENGISADKANTAKKGGGVYVANDTATSAGGSSEASVIVKSGNIWYNEAENGGGVYLEDGQFTMNEETASISHNSATMNGGGIYLYTNPDLLKGTIAENTAAENGGGMYIEDCLVTLNPTGTMTITKNGAKNGAGIFIHGTVHDPSPGPAPTLDPNTQIDAVSSASVRPDDAVGLYVGAETRGKLILTNNIAAINGGAVCIDAADAESRFELDTDKITVTGNGAENGGGVAVLNGNFTMTAGSIGENAGANTAENGGGVYVSGGEVWLRGGSVQYNTAIDGGGAYVTGGRIVMIDGLLANNVAERNGGGAYAAGNFRMLGGTVGGVGGGNGAVNGGGVYVSEGSVYIIYGDISHNHATADGGGVFVSATTTEVQVEMLSGSLSYNEAGTNGGGMAVKSGNSRKIDVKIGCLLDHNVQKQNSSPTLPIAYTGDAYKDYAMFDGKEYKHEACPVVQYNKAGSIGGGFYMDSESSTLSFYCVKETQNTAAKGKENSKGMDVEGGRVIIGDEYYHNHEHNGKNTTDNRREKGPWGYISMDDATLVNGGQVDIYGDMTNPIFKNEVTVNIKDKNDHFMDHRRAYEDETRYKVHYIENFFGTGLYQAFQYDETNAVITIKGALYSHPGYEILGWYTKADYDPTVEDPDNNFYPVGESFDLKDPNSVPQMGTHPINCGLCGETTNDSNLLELYAIWRANGYTVVFNPNVPVGDTYTGTMENQIHRYGAKQKLTENAYKYPGHFFIGWNTKADGSGKSYGDGAEVENLTDKNGATVTLYARWEPCDHKDPHRWSYRLSEDEKTLIRDCSCGGQTLTATLSAENTVYNGHSHPATLIMDDATAWGGDAPTVEHTGERLNAADKTEYGEVELTDDKKPFHAGEYTASITKTNKVDGVDVEVKAHVEYTIAKAEQDPPEKPTYNVSNDKKTVEIDKLEKDSYEFMDDANRSHTAKAEYCLTYTGETNLTWQEIPDESNKLSITMENALTNYIVQARYKELEDYNASEITKADTTYFFAGNVIVRVICDEGINHEIVYAKGTDTDSNGVTLTLTTDSRYYLVGGDYTVTATRCDIDASGNVIANTQENKTPGKESNEKYSITQIPDNSLLTITVGTTRKIPQIKAQVAPRQIFSSFTSTTTTISRDSAFTAAFQIDSFDPTYTGQDGNDYGAYTGLKLTFEQAVPKDTTIILLDRSSGEKTYWYYRAESETGSVLLTNFRKMGGNETEKYSIPKPAKDNGYVNLSYQFIVDFSQVDGGYSKAASLAMTLEAEKSDVTVPEVKPDVTVSMADAAFKLEKADNPAGEDGLTNSFTYTFTAGAAASKWENRASALILTPNEETKLPADAQIKAETDGGTTYLYKNKDAFIVPLSLLQTEDKTVTLTLKSELFPVGRKEYTFTAKWLISPSRAGKAPMTGNQAGSIVDVTFISAERKTPSLKITGTQRVLTAQETLKVHIERENMDGYTISAALQYKAENGIYNGTGWNKMNVLEDSLSVPLKGQAPGSFCLMLTVKQDNSNTIVMEVPYYFVIKQAQ